MSNQALLNFRTSVPSGNVETLVDDLLTMIPVFRGVSSSQETISDVLNDMKLMLPDLCDSDIKFGSVYRLFDAAKDAQFQRLYLQAIFLRLFGPLAFGEPGDLKAFCQNLPYSTLYLWVDRLAGGNLKLMPTCLSYALSADEEQPWRGLLTEPQKLPYTSDMLYQLIVKNIGLYKAGGFFSPYLAICNSNGSGKTRLTMSLASRCVSFFICLRDKALKDGEPPRSLIADFFLKESRFSNEREVRCFLFAAMDTWARLIPTWFQQKDAIMVAYKLQFKLTGSVNFLKVVGDLIAISGLILNGKDYHEEFWSQVMTLYSEYRDNLILKGAIKSTKPSTGDSGANASRDITAQQPSLVTHGKTVETAKLEPSDISTFTKLAAKISLEVKKMGFNEECPIIFIFDEARSMLFKIPNEPSERTLFRLVRQALRCFKDANGFTIMTDTLSRISNFAISDRFDPSRKIEAGSKLFDPVLYLPMINVLKIHHEDLIKREIPAYSTPYKSFKFSLYEELEVGRPLFPARCNLAADTSTAEVNWNDMLRLAHKKFAAPQLLDIEGSATMLAILSVKFGVRYASNLVNTELMSSRMAFGLDISPDREFLKVAYLGEPLIAEVASRIMYNIPIPDRLQEPASLALCLQTLRHNILTGCCILADVGATGEVLMAVLLSLAKDSIAISGRDTNTAVTFSGQLEENSRFCDPFPVGLFLQRLSKFNSIQLDFLNEKHAVLMNSFVSFASFIPMLGLAIRKSIVDASGLPTSPPIISRRLLLLGWKNRVAFYAPPSTPAVDIIIPVMLGELKENETEAYEADESRISCIVVQVKNQAKCLTWSKFNDICDGIEAVCCPPAGDEDPALGLQDMNMTENAGGVGAIHGPESVQAKPPSEKKKKKKNTLESGVVPLLAIVCNVGNSGVSGDVSGLYSGQIPILCLDKSHIYSALGLHDADPVASNLNAITEVRDGPHDSIRRLYDPSRSNAQVRERAFNLIQHMFLDTAALFADGQESEDESPVSSVLPHRSINLSSGVTDRPKRTKI